MAAFETHMLGRKNAQDDYSPEVCAKAAVWFQKAIEGDKHALLSAIMAGLPSAFDRYDIAGLREALTQYDGIHGATLRSNYKRRLQEVVPTRPRPWYAPLCASR
jgi:mannonate dehydratase